MFEYPGELVGVNQSFTESNGPTPVTFTLHGPVSRERYLAEQAIARHRVEQLTPRAPRPERRQRGDYEREY